MKDILKRFQRFLEKDGVQRNPKSLNVEKEMEKKEKKIGTGSNKNR